MRGHKPHVLGPDTKSLVTLILLRQLGGEQRLPYGIRLYTTMAMPCRSYRA